jgi:hypothetical protein
VKPPLARGAPVAASSSPVEQHSPASEARSKPQPESVGVNACLRITRPEPVATSFRP